MPVSLSKFPSKLHPLSVALAATLVGVGSAQALTREEALAKCQDSVGKPAIQACIKGPAAALESCMASVSARVNACTLAAIDAPAAKSAPNSPAPAKDAAKDAPAAGPAVIARARALYQNDKVEDGIALLTEVIARAPKFAPAYAWRANGHNRLGRHAAAVADADKAVDLDPRNAFARYTRAYGYFMQKDFGAALQGLDAITAMDRNYPGAYSLRGWIWSEMGEHLRGLAEIEKAVQLNPSYDAAQNNKGVVLNRLQRYEEAIKAFDIAIRLSPDNPAMRNGRGLSYLGLENYDRALVDFGEAIRLDPDFPRALVNRARAWLEKKNYAAVIRDVGEALQREKKLPLGLMYRARAYEATGELLKSRADFRSALALMPNHAGMIAGLERVEGKLAAAVQSAPRQERAGRVALVIGNSRYSSVEILPNPERDANLVADTLRRSGFDRVRVVIDGGREALAGALKNFAQDAASADWAVVYYAGHGIEVDGSNYLIPVDVKFANDADIPKESIALDQILNAVGAAGKLRLVILDACRENPFVGDMKNGGEGAAVGRGLARIEPESGTLVAFATKHGHLAADGVEGNSPFAKALAARMAMPGLEISQLFRLVHDDVYKATDKKQEPFTYGQLSAQSLYFRLQ